MLGLFTHHPHSYPPKKPKETSKNNALPGHFSEETFAEDVSTWGNTRARKSLASH